MVTLQRDLVGWTAVRCPTCRDMLGEVAGGRLRKVCPRCRPKVLVTFDAATATYQLDQVDGTALQVAAVSAGVGATRDPLDTGVRTR